MKKMTEPTARELVERSAARGRTLRADFPVPTPLQDVRVCGFCKEPLREVRTLRGMEWVCIECDEDETSEADSLNGMY